MKEETYARKFGFLPYRGTRRGRLWRIWSIAWTNLSHQWNRSSIIKAIMIKLFNQILYIPIFNLLVFFYNTIAFNDFGFAIVLVTFLIRLILSPLSLKSLKSQTALQRLQPKIKEIQEKFKNDRQKQAQATMQLYKDYNVNPFSGCLPLLIQLPILIALYQVSRAGFEENALSVLYSFINNPGSLKEISFGIINLKNKNIYLAILAGATQFFQSKLSLGRHKEDKLKNIKKEGTFDIAQAMSKQMLYFFPFMTIIIAIQFPAGLSIYWVTTTLFTLGEQLIINKRLKTVSQKNEL